MKLDKKSEMSSICKQSKLSIKQTKEKKSLE
ncbi:hypothetical protein Pmani_029083, partial [Petrolisthes manimaculis]